MGTAKAGDSRVWLVKRPGTPAATVEYLSCVKAGDPSWGLGDITKVECPDPEVSGEFVTTDEYRGAKDMATLQITGRYPLTLSDLLALAREGCTLDVQVHWGTCKTRNDYKSGWQKITSFPAAGITQWAGENFGAIESGDQNPVNEIADVSAREIYEIKELAFTEQGKTTVVRELISVDVCDTRNCGTSCGAYSDGCSKVFAVMLGTGATPGTKPSVVYSEDGGTTTAATDIDTMFSNETPTDGECMGQWFVVSASTSNSLHYAESADILEGTETWAETISGFVAGATPQALYAADSRHLWIVATSGYVYFTDDPSTAVVVQDAGVATTAQLNDVHGCDAENIVAVGNANAIIHTEDGETWAAVTGPAAEAGVNARAVWVYSPDAWDVLYADGHMYYTLDGGINWTSVTLPGSPTDLTAIKFTNDNRVGYIAGLVGASGKIWRNTASGAASEWYMLPESSASIPANARINDLAVCEDNPNVVWGAGLAAGSTDGFLVKAS